MPAQTHFPQSPWLLAIRPKTLPAAAAPVLVGSALAFYEGAFRLWPALACLLAALLLQIASNLANDVFDYEKGADQGERLGPTRVTQAGLLTPAQVKRGLGLVLGLAALLGIYLSRLGGWPILALGVTAILSAVAYTGGPFPLGYHGLGDLFVFIFFGLAATAGTYYLQAGALSLAAWGMGAAMGLLTVNILVVNNLRDLENDRRVGKRTLAVRLGERGARWEYLFCLMGACAIPVALWSAEVLPVWGLLPLLSLPWAFPLLRAVYSAQGRALNPILAGTGRFELLYAVFFAIGMALASFFR
jgi:1,4-dihydroxy-2-naphthoate octaprenyltransferase